MPLDQLSAFQSCNHPQLDSSSAHPPTHPSFLQTVYTSSSSIHISVHSVVSRTCFSISSLSRLESCVLSTSPSTAVTFFVVCLTRLGFSMAIKWETPFGLSSSSSDDSSSDSSSEEEGGNSPGAPCSVQNGSHMVSGTRCHA